VLSALVAVEENRNYFEMSCECSAESLIAESHNGILRRHQTISIWKQIALLLIY